MLTLQIDNSEIEDIFVQGFESNKDKFLDFIKNSYAQKVLLDEYDYAKNAPESVIVSSVEEVQRRVALAEERVGNGEYDTEEEYEKKMNLFFEEELGIKR